jgi:hypothetical protein
MFDTPPKADMFSISADFKHQLALKMARFAYSVRFGSICELIADDRGRPNCADFEKAQHSLEMCAIANDIGT